MLRLFDFLESDVLLSLICLSSVTVGDYFYVS